MPAKRAEAGGVSVSGDQSVAWILIIDHWFPPPGALRAPPSPCGGGIPSRVRRRSEEASPAPVRPLAAPECAVGGGLGFRERDRLHLEQVIAVRRKPHALAGNDEAVALAAAPFAGVVAMAAARNPAVVGGSVGSDEKEGSKDERKP